MKRVRARDIFMVLAIALTTTSIPVSASLVATQFGFPSIFHAAESTAFNRDTAEAFSYEDVNINFGAGMPFAGGAQLAFPSISQTSVQSQALTHTDFFHTEEVTAIAFPYAGIGCAPVPGFGFGF